MFRLFLQVAKHQERLSGLSAQSARPLQAACPVFRFRAALPLAHSRQSGVTRLNSPTAATWAVPCQPRAVEYPYHYTTFGNVRSDGLRRQALMIDSDRTTQARRIGAFRYVKPREVCLAGCHTAVVAATAVGAAFALRRTTSPACSRAHVMADRATAPAHPAVEQRSPDKQGNNRDAKDQDGTHHVSSERYTTQCGERSGGKSPRSESRPISDDPALFARLMLLFSTRSSARQWRAALPRGSAGQSGRVWRSEGQHSWSSDVTVDGL
jgi:hypothetical protein